MSDWSWAYDPDEEHVAGGVPAAFVAEVERLAEDLVVLARTGADLDHVGEGPRPGGMRQLEVLGGFFFFLAFRRGRLIVITRIVPPFDSL